MIPRKQDTANNKKWEKRLCREGLYVKLTYLYKQPGRCWGEGLEGVGGVGGVAMPGDMR